MRHWGRVHLQLALLYATFIALGRLTRLAEGDIALWWPASGIAVLWGLRARGGAQLAICAVAVLVIAGCGNALTGLAVTTSVGFAVANAAIAVGAAATSGVLTRRGRRWTAGRPALRLPRDLGHLIGVVAGGVAAGAPAVLLTLGLADAEAAWDLVLQWLTRNVLGAFAVSALWLTWVDRDWSRALATLAGHRRSRTAEAALLAVLTGAALVQVFVVDHELPLVFLLIAMSVWAGARFPPFPATVHAVGTVTGAAVLHALDLGGPLRTQDPFTSVMVIQAWGVLALLVTLFLSTALQEKDRVSASLGIAERDARSRADLLATMTQAMVDGLVVVNGKGVPLVVNEAAAALGADQWTREAHEGGGAANRFLHLDGSRVGTEEHPVRRALRGEATPTLDLVHEHPVTGKRTVVSVSAAPVGAAVDPEQQLAVLLLRDVTVRHRQLSQLQAFAGVVAHDLQNPLFASKGWAEVAAEGLDGVGEGVKPQVREALRRTISSLGRAQLLVNDLLGFTRASTESVEVRTVDLDTLVEGEMAELRVRYQCPDAVLEKGELGEVRMDPTLARQLFGNLLGNAVKYVGEGVVPRVRARVARDSAGVRIDVTDNGPGIPQEHRERVFEPFHRVRPDVPGTGLGLAICAEAVHRHGGTIRVADGPEGTGTTFSVHLPRGACVRDT